MLGRIVIDDVHPRTPTGFPAKAAAGEAFPVSADVFKDGHDILAARVRIGTQTWPLTLTGNDRWEAEVTLEQTGRHELVVEAWVANMFSRLTGALVVRFRSRTPWR